jgi:hypothetical protein
MGNDYRVKPRSNDEVKALAKRLLVECGTDNRFPVNVLSILNRNEINTDFGNKRLICNVVPDNELGDDDAVTKFENGVVTITVKETVWQSALLGVGRSRMTIAHELGHAVMHEGPPMARATGARGRSALLWIKSFESAEHQAKIFASALLIPDWAAAELQSAAEISTQFGVSLEAASIYFEELREKRNRANSVQRVDRLAAEFRQSVNTKSYIESTCPNCGRETVRLNGMKTRCDTCGRIGDSQDGDEFVG